MSSLSRAMPQQDQSDGRSSGFSLVEVLVATAILSVAIVTLGHLFVLAGRGTTTARATTFASVLAAAKMEELLGTPPRASPSGALAADTPGYSDFLDATGRSLGAGATPPASAAYVRRWSIDPLPGAPQGTFVLQVLVITAAAGHPDAARIVALQTRRSN